jgi:histidinol phosphatase-like PHP family hydrolase
MTPEQLIDAAWRSGIQVIGITDHAFVTGGYKDSMCSEGAVLAYFQNLRRLGSFMPNVQVLAGLEISVSLQFGAEPTKLPFKTLNQGDYALFENVGAETDSHHPGFRGIGELVAIRERLTIPVGLAHADLQMYFDGKEEALAKILSENDIFVELCQSEKTQGFFGYKGRNTRDGLDYYRLFSSQMIAELKKHGVRFAVGTDTHTGEGIGNIEDAHRFIVENSLKVWERVE